MRLCLSILFGKEATGLVALAAAFLGCCYVDYSSLPEPIAFKNLQEIKELVVSKGLVLHTGNTSGIFDGNFFIADHPVTFESLLDIPNRSDCGQTPAWLGIVWVSQIKNSSGNLFPEQLGGKWRKWGNIVVAGDEDLMNRIEEFSHSRN